mmetsp:Transcript_9392/g.12211  ORF Transcript_9392/g.12211 Transcript_9392/m.12211 type:complete len:306 (-) Transcript_9392:1525-2442(-)
MPVLSLDDFSLACVDCARLLWGRRVPREEVEQSLKLINQVVANILKHPDELKYKKLRCSNKKVKKYITDVPGALNLFLQIGFRKVVDREGEKPEYVYLYESDETIGGGNSKLNWYAGERNEIQIQSLITSFDSSFKPIKFKLEKNGEEFLALFNDLELVEDIYAFLGNLPTLDLPNGFAVFQNAPRKFIEKGTGQKAAGFFGTTLFVMNSATKTVGGASQEKFLEQQMLEKEAQAERHQKLKQEKEQKRAEEARVKAYALRAFQEDREKIKESVERRQNFHSSGENKTLEFPHLDQSSKTEEDQK